MVDLAEEVRQAVSSMNLPGQIQALVERRLVESIPPILQRNVPALVEANVGWYKEQIQLQSVEIEKLHEGLAAEASKRRKVHRSLMATVARVKELQAELHDFKSKPVDPPVTKRRFWPSFSIRR